MNWNEWTCYFGFRRKAGVRKCKPFFVAKSGVMVSGVDSGNWVRERDIARSWQNALFSGESFCKCRALYVHLTYKDVDRIIFLKASQVSSSLKRFREIRTESIAVLTKNRQSMTAWGFCCYYLVHIAVKHIIAIKRTKYVSWTRTKFVFNHQIF